MNFFGLQDVARRDSLILLFSFAAAMLIFGWIISKVALGVAFLAAFVYPDIEPRYIQQAMVGSVWGYVLYRSFVRWRDINEGGGMLAVSFTAEPMADAPGNRQERQLLNVVAEMGIAASVATLPVYVLRDEQVVNAFVLGRQDSPALVVTQGVIDQLDRDEMAAVVAHEYAHVANRDLSLNMRMLVALGGLNAIDELGAELIDGATDSSDRGHIADQMSDSWGLGALVIGCLLRVLGRTLVFFGDIIKAAFAKKRELLADASAVQFTRDSWGLACVLDKAPDERSAPSLSAPFSVELEHVCLIGPWGHSLWSGRLANHPPPAARVALIEPHFDVKQRNRARRDPSDTASEAASSAAGSAAGASSVVPLDLPAAAVSAPIQDSGAELAIVLSRMVVAAGYDVETSRKNFQNIMRCYSASDYELRLPDEEGFEAEYDRALDTLLEQSPLQRQALINHVAEIMAHDGINEPAEKAMFDLICSRLNPQDRAA